MDVSHIAVEKRLWNAHTKAQRRKVRKKSFKEILSKLQVSRWVGKFIARIRQKGRGF
jgi:hypothetical protein